VQIELLGNFTIPSKNHIEATRATSKYVANTQTLPTETETQVPTQNKRSRASCEQHVEQQTQLTFATTTARTGQVRTRRDYCPTCRRPAQSWQTKAKQKQSPKCETESPSPPTWKQTLANPGVQSTSTLPLDCTVSQLRTPTSTQRTCYQFQRQTNVL